MKLLTIIFSLNFFFVACTEGDKAEFLQQLEEETTADQTVECSLVKAGGDNQLVSPGAALSEALSVKASDKGGKFLAGVPVLWKVSRGKGATLAKEKILSDKKGLASNTMTLGTNPGIYTITATCGTSSVNFFAEVPACKLVKVSGDKQTGTASQPLANPFVVEAKSNLGDPLYGQTISFDIMSGSGASLSTVETTLGASINKASTLLTLGSAGGSYSVSATCGDSTVIFTAEAPVTNENQGDEGNNGNEGDPDALTIVAGNLQVKAPGETFGVLKVQKLSGGSPHIGETIFFSIVSGTNGTFDNASPVTDALGIASVNFTAGNISGPTVVRAIHGAKSVDFALEVSDPSDANIVLLEGDNQTAGVGTVLPTNFKVRVLDGAGAPMDNVAIRFVVTTNAGLLESTSSSLTKLTAIDGIAEANFRLAEQAGANQVRAEVSAKPSEFVMFDATGTVDPNTPPDLNQSTVTTTPTSLEANGVAVASVVMTAKDAFGNQIPGGTQTVIFTPTEGTMLGSVVNNGNGTYTQTFRAPAGSGSGLSVITATTNGNAIVDNAVISLTSGSYDTTQSTVVAATNPITANGSDSTIITVTLKDGLGNQLNTGGETVIISATSGTLLGSVVDVGDGTYTQILRASTIAGPSTVTATVNGSSITDNEIVVFQPGPADLNNTVIVASPTSLNPDATSTSTITVILKDLYSNTLTSSGGTVVLNTTAGTWGNALTDNGDGTYQRTLVASATPATALITGTLDGNAINNNVTVYMTGAGSGANLANSTIEIVGSNYIPADGSTTAIVRVTLKDANNNVLSGGGSAININATAGTLLGSVTDNSNGTYEQIIRAPSSSAIALLTAVVDGQNMEDSENGYFYGSISLNNSLVTALPTAIDGNGSSTATIKLTALDSSGISIPVGGLTDITFTTTLGTMLGSVQDNSDGTYSQSLQSVASAGTAVITPRKSGSPFTNTVSVTFYTGGGLTGGTVIDCSNIGTYKNTGIIIDGVTVTMNSHGVQGNCPEEFVFDFVVIKNSGVLQHSGQSTTAEYGLEFSADSVTIDGSSKIDVSGKGYYISNNTNVTRMPGNALVNYGVSGGSHGGSGYKWSGSLIPTYGNMAEPFTMGSSGQTDNTSHDTQAGGGRVKITLTNGGSIKIDGSILANGSDGSSTADVGIAGAGGSIWINTATIEGAGLISADGGYARNSGGGGRIAIYYTEARDNFSLGSEAFMSNVKACGKVYSTRYSAPGTIFLKKNTDVYPDLLIHNCGIGGRSGGINTVINFPSPGTSALLGTTSLTSTGAFNDVAATGTGVGTYFSINPNTGQNGTSTRLDDTLYLITSVTGDAATITTGNLQSVGNTGDPFELVLRLNNLEIRDFAILDVGTNPVIVENGDIFSGDTSTVTLSTWPSSLEFRNNPANWRIKDSSSFVFRKAVSGTTLVIDNVSSATAHTCLVGTTCFNFSSSIQIINGSTLYQAETTATDEYSIEMIAPNITIDGTSKVSAYRRGYIGTDTNEVMAFGNTKILDTAGGSHGGQGSDDDGGAPVDADYGNIFNPRTSGGGGTDQSGYTADQDGGGVIRIETLGGTLTLNGELDADGYRNNNRGGSGAGGSIYIETGALNGTGSVHANGGDCTANCFGAGGGGRVAVYFVSSSGNFTYPGNFMANVSAAGGWSGASPGTSTENAAAGTIYVKSSSHTYGDLIIDNKGITVNTSVNTRIFLPSGTSSALTATSLTDAGAFADFLTTESDALVGMYINPNTAQNGTSTLHDDTVYKIVGQTINELTIAAGDMTATGSAGNSYKAVLILDNLEVKGGARLLVWGGGEILVKEGDISSGNTSSVTIGGGMSGRVDFSGLQNLSISDSSVTLYEPVVGSSVTLSNNANLTMKVEKGTRAIDLTGDLNILSGATITQANTTLTEEYSLEIRAANINIDSGSGISASSKGYYSSSTTQMRGFPNVYMPQDCGGIHGGQGGCEDGTASNYTSYGSIFNPYTSGGGGARGNSTSDIAYGGGIIRLEVTGTLSNDGYINSTGVFRYRGSGGAGGSIYINTGTITGSGTINASGGDYLDTNAYDGGGSGGRVAIYYSVAATGAFSYPTNLINSVFIDGGMGITPSEYGASGTLFVKGPSHTYGDLIIDNRGNGATVAKTIINMPTGTIGTISSSSIGQTGAYNDMNGVSSGYMTGLWIAPNLNENGTDSMLDNTLVKVTSHDSNDLTLDSDPTGVASVSDTYRAVLRLDNLDIRGGARVSFEDGHVIVYKGDVSSGDDTTVAWDGAIIGAGRIDFPEPGTTFVIDTGDDHSFEFLKFDGNLNINGGILQLGEDSYDKQLDITGNLTLTNEGYLYVRDTTQTAQYRLYAYAGGNISVDGTSVISASTRGHDDNNTNYSVGVNLTLDWNESNGGSHGGRGGYRTLTPTTLTYGSFTEPTQIGMSGGRDAAGAGHGGGALRLYAGGSFTNNGVISANGQGTGSDAGGGAGGSIWITAVGALTGSGTFTANGGNVSASTGGGGGGGRIALYYGSLGGSYTSSNMFTYAQAYGGTSNTTTSNGGAGTIYLKASGQTYGDLIIDNGGNDASSDQSDTELGKSPAGTGSLTATTISAANAFQSAYSTADFFKGLYINPNTGQNGTLTISDDTLFRIDSSSDSLATIASGDMTTVGSSGDPYRTVLRLDNLEIRGNATLDVGTNDIYVTSGDLSSGDTTTFVLDGRVKANVIDVGGATYSKSGNGNDAGVTTVCDTGGCGAP